MQLQTLSLLNFRNFRHVDEIVFPKSQKLLVAAAPNATGKTNFLEAVHFLLRGKSFRASPAECVGWGEEIFQIGARVSTQRGDSFLSVQYSEQGKTLRFEQDEKPASLITFYRGYPFILFLPEDTFLFVRGPAGRRNFLNSVLICGPTYLASLVHYHRILRQRNGALKNGQGATEVEVWTRLLVEQASVLWDQRQAFIQFINSHLPDLYYGLSGEEKSPLLAELVMGMPQGEDSLEKALHTAWPQEQRYQYTMYGPHRDDMRLMVDGRPVKVSFSRGQMRLLVLALKILAWQYIKQTTQEAPLLLLDEVLSELDEKRQRRLLDGLPEGQTLLTCTSLPSELTRREAIHMLDLRRILLPPQPVQQVPVAAVAA